MIAKSWILDVNWWQLATRFATTKSCERDEMCYVSYVDVRLDLYASMFMLSVVLCKDSQAVLRRK
eukprot:scaffold118427_cov22-Cyclotella_meneghiniana.AAC.1